MASVKFYLRKKEGECSIYVALNISADVRHRTSTGKQINYDDWGKEGLPKQNSEANMTLHSNFLVLKSNIIKNYTVDSIAGVVINQNWLRKQVDICFNAEDNKGKVSENDNYFSVYLKNFIEYKRHQGDVTDETIQNYVQLQTKFTAFEKHTRKYLIKEIDRDLLINKFKKFLSEKIKKKLMDSTIRVTMGNLKTVLLDAKIEGGKEVHRSIDKFSIKLKKKNSNTDVNKVFLSPVELEKIKKANIISDALIYARDWLIIGCNTGQRVSDLFRMNKRMIYTITDANGNSLSMIRLKQEKTSKEVSIPINEEVQAILNKYNGEFPPLFGVSIKSSTSIFNKRLKRICEIAKINDKVKGKVFNKDEKVMKNEIKDIEKWRLVSSHVCRRSFATNYYGDGRFTTAEIMAVTGHKTETVFLDYIGKSNEDFSIAFASKLRKFEEEQKQKTV